METQLTSQLIIETLPALRVACYCAVSPSPEADGNTFMEVRKTIRQDADQ